MANRWLNQFKHSLLKFPAELHLQFAVGAAGAATISAARSKGVTSVTRGGSAGLYTIVLNDRWQRLLGVQQSIVIAAGTSSGVFECVVKADNTNDAAKSVVLQFLNAAGAAADIANGATVRMKLELTNSSLD